MKITEIHKLFTKETYNFLYWLFNKPLGIIVVQSYISQKGGKIINNNLGDDLNFYMLKELTGKKVVNYNNIRTFGLPIKRYICIGSIFEWFVDSSSIVWGTGSMFGGKKAFHRPQKICAVRGPLTQKALAEQGIPCPEVYGDPALLLPLVYCPQVNKKYKIGIIPHYADSELDNVSVFCAKYKSDVCFIHMRNYRDWKEVIDEICSCEFVISSSLHGLIIADAYHIPNVWIRLSDNVKGGDFKYFDYFASVGREEKEPLDYREKEIIFDDICTKIREYHPITFSYKSLIEACPFLSAKRKKILVDKALMNSV